MRHTIAAPRKKNILPNQPTGVAPTSNNIEAVSTHDSDPVTVRSGTGVLRSTTTIRKRAWLPDESTIGIKTT